MFQNRNRNIAEKNKEKIRKKDTKKEKKEKY